MTEKTETSKDDTKLIHAKKHRTREIQYQLERIANMIEQDEPPKIERRKIIATVLREIAQFMDNEYNDCVERLKCLENE